MANTRPATMTGEQVSGARLTLVSTGLGLIFPSGKKPCSRVALFSVASSSWPAWMSGVVTLKSAPSRGTCSHNRSPVAGSQPPTLAES